MTNEKETRLITAGIVLAIAAVLVGTVVYLSTAGNGTTDANANGAPPPVPENANEQPRPADDRLGTYFRQRLVASGVADVGQPIEGFDAGLLMLAFPGLLESDFHMVETLEGHYEFKGGALTHVRNQDQPVSSAERTVSDEGYATLLLNVSSRMDMKAGTEADVDRIIAAINTDETIQTKIDQGGSAFGVTIVPLEVMEDSRCPSDVQCIWAGTVRLRARVESGGGTSEETFELGKAVQKAGVEITLDRVDPAPHSGTRLNPADYTFSFKITKR